VRAAVFLVVIATGGTHQLPDPEPAVAPAGLVEEIADWVAAEMALDEVPGLPRLVLLPAAQMRSARVAAMRDAGIDTSAYERGRPRPVLAFYDERSGVIHLAVGWSGATPAEQSILVHEMVHHFQARTGQRFACAGERERPAYAAQARWLERSGLTLEGAFRINRMFLVMVTNCFH
jgi:hypothetical protein